MAAAQNALAAFCGLEIGMLGERRDELGLPNQNLNVLLLQRVLQDHGRCKIRRVVRGRGIGTATLRKRKIFDPPSVEQTRKALIAFDAARLGVESVLFVTLSGEFLLDG